jgi:hypothetical protein
MMCDGSWLTNFAGYPKLPSDGVWDKPSETGSKVYDMHHVIKWLRRYFSFKN